MAGEGGRFRTQHREQAGGCEAADGLVERCEVPDDRREQPDRIDVTGERKVHAPAWRERGPVAIVPEIGTVNLFFARDDEKKTGLAHCQTRSLLA